MARARKPTTGGRSGINPDVMIIGGIAVVLAIGIGWWAMRDKKEDGKAATGDETASATDAAPSAPALAPYAFPTPAHGPDTAKAVLVKYTDFQ